ncbi:MAG: aldehyde dehydrogenase family protein [Planctomycetota bacterium]
MKHASLQRPPSNLIGGRWLPLPAGPSAITSTNPAHPSSTVWSGLADPTHVDSAVAAARQALKVWSHWPGEKRAQVLRTFQDIAARRVNDIAAIIQSETGKVAWDSKAEATLLGAKVDITLDAGPDAAMRRVTGFETPLADTRSGRCWFRPHGVMAVLGPFNFPAHLPNGHIIPALAMGNTIVLKPSDKTPGVGQLLGELYQEALDAHGAPPGVVNVVQGRADIAQSLVAHDDLDAVLFTGSWPVGRAIMAANLDRPGRMLALEMGGNNAAVILPDADLRQAVIECVRSAFITTGQRCTCTRRVIVHESIAPKVIAAICKAASNLIVGDPAAPHPVFMGPVISESARKAILDAQSTLAKAGGEVLVPCTSIDGEGWFISPGVMRVPRFELGTTGPGADIEIFGPFLRVSTAASLDDALTQANATNFGLAASIFTRDQAAIDQFLTHARAGCVNVNTGTAGASSKLPFGGLGQSGNHRPAGAFSLDYCAYPVAGMIEKGQAAQIPAGMRFEPDWI